MTFVRVPTREVVSDPQPLLRHQLGDHLESSSIELDEQGDIISYEEYYPYGSTSYQAVDSATEVSAKRYRFTGKERDEESGLYYHGARYYAPWLARWTAADPAGMVDGVNLFAYVRGNPVRLVDPDGRESGGGSNPSNGTGLLTKIYNHHRTQVAHSQAVSGVASAVDQAEDSVRPNWYRTQVFLSEQIYGYLKAGMNESSKNMRLENLNDAEIDYLMSEVDSAQQGLRSSIQSGEVGVLEVNKNNASFGDEELWLMLDEIIHSDLSIVGVESRYVPLATHEVGEDQTTTLVDVSVVRYNQLPSRTQINALIRLPIRFSIAARERAGEEIPSTISGASSSDSLAMIFLNPDRGDDFSDILESLGVEPDPPLSQAAGTTLHEFLGHAFLAAIGEEYRHQRTFNTPQYFGGRRYEEVDPFIRAVTGRGAQNAKRE